jgi:L-asparaginase II
MTLRIEVQVRRGPILESRHLIEAALADPDGGVHAATGEPRMTTSFRSSAKPFQLLALVERGHAERWAFSDEEVAVMAASHTGSARHRRLVKGILDRIGLDESRLACGFHEPIDPESLAELRAHPELRSPLYNNCSGKHAGMLALACAEGWASEGYERPEHPVQQLALRSVAEVCGMRLEDVATGTDDCGVVVFGMPLASMARGYARLATARADGDARERALFRIRSAMMAHPQAVGGAARFSTRLMEACAGRIVAKGGAEGLECFGIPERGLGAALKARDGASRPLGPAAVALLDHLGVLSEAERERLAPSREPAFRNHSGREVGRLVTVLEVTRPRDAAPVT